MINMLELEGENKLVLTRPELINSIVYEKSWGVTVYFIGENDFIHLYEGDDDQKAESIYKKAKELWFDVMNFNNGAIRANKCL
jgi:phosphosulfolactate synthase (CoM biosynthesis protein A)